MRIEVIDINGKNQKTFVSMHITQVDNIAAYGGFLYCLDDKTGLETITVNGERRSVELQRLPQFTNISAVWTPDAKVLRNHMAQSPKLFPHLHSQRGVTRSTHDVCSCPKHLMLLEDKENYGIYPAR
ncbi:uncharacterized protein [Drosophila pseudoobscura]|uniref:Uncharacterized protein n=1 Tax=Drosophila pseudoobscura pseudoobscura TaxID=46245 RepID=A0A6I8VYT2_DROPS|nr:uncharacterized protein LOC26532306 [Drosophila pseudoobscura]